MTLVQFGDWWKRSAKGHGALGTQRFSVPTIDYRANCTHAMGVQGQKCPWCGGVVQ